MKLHEIREAKAAKVAQARSLLDGEMTPEKQKAFEGLKTEIENLEKDEARQQFVDDMERRSAPVDKSLNKLESRITLLDAIQAQVENRSLTGALAEFNQEQQRNGIQAKGVLVPASTFETRAANTTSTGSTIVPDDFRADQFIGLLRNSQIVRSLGARTLPNLRGDVVIPKQTSTTSATWLNEGDGLTDASTLGFGTVSLTPHHVGAITELSRQLIQQSNPAIEKLVRDDFTAVIGLAVDKALLHGDNNKQPKGIVDAATGTGSLATLGWQQVLTVIQNLNTNHINPNYWLATPTVATILRSELKAATSGSSYLMENGKMADIPVAVSPQLEDKTGTPDTGRMILGDWSELLIGTWGAVDILANPYGAAYARGGVAVRILTTMDAVARRTEAFTVIDDIALS